MKLESLKDDKFEPFKQNEIQDAMKYIYGGDTQTNFHTTYQGVKYQGTDVYANNSNVDTISEYGTSGGYSWVSVNGNNADGTPHTGNVDYKRTSVQKVID